MAIAIAKTGGIGVIHRNLDIKKQIFEIKKVKKLKLLVGAAVGAGPNEFIRAKAIIKEGVDLIVVDTAHGHTKKVAEIIQFIKRFKNNKIALCAGNIATSEAAKYLTSDFIPVSNDSTITAAAVDGKIESLKITAGSGYTNGTYYAAIYGDGTSAGTSSGGIVRITVSGGTIQSFGLTAGSDTTIHAGGAAYTFGTVNLATGFTFSDTGLSSASAIGGSGGEIEVVISPKNGHGFSAIKELGGHYVMTATTLTQAENDDITTSNDFRQVGLVVDPTTFGTSTVASSSTARQTYVIKASSVSGTFEVDEKITQATSGAVGKVVEYDSTLSLLYYQQERFGDFGTNSTTGDHSVLTVPNV